MFRIVTFGQSLQDNKEGLIDKIVINRLLTSMVQVKEI